MRFKVKSRSSHQSHGYQKRQYLYIDSEYLQLYRQEALRQQLVASDGIVKVLMTKTFPQS